MISGAGDPARAAARHGRGRASTWSAATTGWSCCSRRRSTRRTLEPGYIKGYLPGVRENGGQYTHAAIWVVHGLRRCWATATRPSSCSRPAQPDQPRQRRAPASQRYKVEPYVVAGDVYAEPPHVGRGGWTWYTGSAGWMYRAGLESILGFRLRGRPRSSIDPCIPRAWPGFEITFRYHAAVYSITVENPRGAMRGVTAAELDGAALSITEGGAAEIGLVTEGRHAVRVVLG